MAVNVTAITARIDGHRIVDYRGRMAWTLAALVEAGPKGITPIERPAPRWSHYVFQLRQDGVAIETIEETHSGPFKGTHGRYVLRSHVEILEALKAA